MNFRGNGWNIECVKEESGKGRSYIVLMYKALRKLKRGRDLYRYFSEKE